MKFNFGHVSNAFLGFAIVSILAVGALSFTLNTTGEDYTIDAAASSIKWKGYKVTGSHNGVVSVKSGTLTFDKDVLTGGSFVIDMTTIDVQDLKGGGKKKLEGHLNSPDFFSTKKYPTAKFVITKAIPYGGNYKIVGNLTIKDTTKEIKFIASVAKANSAIAASAKVTIDRSDFNVRYGSGSFFDNLGDKTIYDEFDLEINLLTDK